LYPDTKVYVKIDEAQTRWVPAVIKDIHGVKYYVVFENGYGCNPQEHHQSVDIKRLLLR
jgi:hypothetical protein